MFPMVKEYAFGQQVAYVPYHVRQRDLSGKTWIADPDTELGFVVRQVGQTVFCRYWSQHNRDLRTKANSEACDARYLVVHNSRPQEDVEAAIERYNIQ